MSLRRTRQSSGGGRDSSAGDGGRKNEVSWTNNILHCCEHCTARILLYGKHWVTIHAKSVDRMNIGRSLCGYSSPTSSLLYSIYFDILFHWTFVFSLLFILFICIVRYPILVERRKLPSSREKMNMPRITRRVNHGYLLVLRWGCYTLFLLVSACIVLRMMIADCCIPYTLMCCN